MPYGEKHIRGKNGAYKGLRPHLGMAHVTAQRNAPCLNTKGVQTCSTLQRRVMHHAKASRAH